MTAYLEVDGERLLLDTKKAKVVYEGRELDMTGQKIVMYDADWAVADGKLGADGVPCKVLVLEDPFTGLAVEVPMPQEAADAAAAGLADNGDKRRARRLRRLLG